MKGRPFREWTTFPMGHKVHFRQQRGEELPAATPTPGSAPALSGFQAMSVGQIVTKEGAMMAVVMT